MKKVPWEDFGKSKLNSNTQWLFKKTHLHVSQTELTSGNDQKQPLRNCEVFSKKGALSCHISILQTLVDLLWIRRLFQKQPSRVVLSKRCSENMQQIYKKTPMPKCNFKKVAIEITFWHGCSPVNLLHIFRTHFPKSASGGLFLQKK